MQAAHWLCKRQTGLESDTVLQVKTEMLQWFVAVCVFKSTECWCDYNALNNEWRDFKDTTLGLVFCAAAAHVVVLSSKVQIQAGNKLF